MSRSFTTSEERAVEPPHIRRRVLVTGAAGRIGSYFAEQAHRDYDLRLMILPGDGALDRLQGFGEVVACDLGDLERLKEACRDIDTVVHLAAVPNASATWSALLPTNIVGTYHLFVAAKAAGCRRVVFASSIHAVSGYAPDVQVKTSEPVNPGDLYGVSKCFGEALGRYMAEQEGLSVIVLRIGAYQPLENMRREAGIRFLDAFVSHRDLHQLIERSIDVEHLQFGIFHAISDNRFKRLDISDARTLLGYTPQDDLTQEHPGLKQLDLRHAVSTHTVADAHQQSGLREDL